MGLWLMGLWLMGLWLLGFQQWAMPTFYWEFEGLVGKYGADRSDVVHDEGFRVPSSTLGTPDAAGSQVHVHAVWVSSKAVATHAVTRGLRQRTSCLACPARSREFQGGVQKAKEPPGEA